MGERRRATRQDVTFDAVPITMAPEYESKSYMVNGRWVFPSETPENKLLDPLVWIDLEMTGLDIKKDVIIEIACIVTDGSLDRQIQGPEIAIKYEDVVFENMHPWCIQQHNKSGLVQRCKESLFDLAQAEKIAVTFIKPYVDSGYGVLAGNSIHMDKLFLEKYMPTLHSYLSYRVVDVTTIKELCKRWYPDVFQQRPRKKQSHTAMSDIEESIAELKYYRQRIFHSV